MRLSKKKKNAHLLDIREALLLRATREVKFPKCQDVRS